MSLYLQPSSGVSIDAEEGLVKAGLLCSGYLLQLSFHLPDGRVLRAIDFGQVKIKLLRLYLQGFDHTVRKELREHPLGHLSFLLIKVFVVLWLQVHVPLCRGQLVPGLFDWRLFLLVNASKAILIALKSYRRVIN